MNRGGYRGGSNRGGGGGPPRGGGGPPRGGGGFRGGRGAYGGHATYEDIPLASPLDLSTLKLALKPIPGFTPRKQVANRLGTKQISLLTNAYELTVKPSKIFLYDVAFFLNFEDGNRTELILNKDDASSRNLFELKFYLLDKAMVDNKLCEKDKSFAYDGNKLLFTYKEISKLLPKEGFYTIALEDITEHFQKIVLLRNLKSIDLIIQKAEAHSEIDSTGFEVAQMSGKLSSSDCSYSHAFDVITSMKAASTSDFIVFGDGVIYPKKQTLSDTPNKQVKYDGISKSTRFVEGKQRNKVVPVILMDYRMGQFFAPCDLYEYISNVARSECKANISHSIPKNVRVKVEQKLKGIRLDSKSGRDSLTFKGFSNDPVSEIEVSKTMEDGTKTKISLASVYEKNMKINKDLHAIVSAREKNGRFTPFFNILEDLSIAPHQRVKQVKITKNCGIKPEVPQIRHDKTRSMIKMIGMDGSRNSVLDSFQLSVSKEPMIVQAFYRSNPTLVYGKGVIKTPNSDGSWTSREFFCKPAEGFQMIAMYEISNLKESVENFIFKVKGELREKGCVTFNDIRVKGIKRTNLENEFKAISDERKKTIIFYIADDDEIHGELKYYERKYLIPTQHVLSKNIQDYNGPNVNRTTLTNICLKTNLKTGGLNHSVIPDSHSVKNWLSDKKTLVISYVLHRGRTAYDAAFQVPSVVGFSFNAASHTESFVGDYKFQDPKQPYVDITVLDSIMKHVLKLFFASNRQAPERIVLLREGVAESQFSHIIENELTAIRKSFAEHAQAIKLFNWKPKFQFILITKKHNLRFYRFRERSSSEPARGVERDVHNLDVATVMDCQIVRPNVTEFFMQAHKVIIGAGRIPLYTVLVDELNWSMDSIQSFMLALCYTHQISVKPISLPEPLYQATEWAKRGSDMILYQKNRFGPLGENYEELTNQLAYAGTRLALFRVNA